MLRPGIEPGSKRWERSILPLNYRSWLKIYHHYPHMQSFCFLQPSYYNYFHSNLGFLKIEKKHKIDQKQKDVFV